MSWFLVFGRAGGSPQGHVNLHAAGHAIIESIDAFFESSVAVLVDASRVVVASRYVHCLLIFEAFV